MVKAFFLVPFLSLHTQPYNDFTPGIGVEAQDDAESYSAAYFRDSEGRPSWYAGYGAFHGDRVRIGAFCGAMNRKKHGTFAFVLPVISMQYLNVIYVPPLDTEFGKIDQALHFQLRIPF